MKAGVQDTALEDVVLRGQKVWRLVNEIPTPMKGDQVILGKDPNEPMSMEEYMEDLQDSAPHLFKSTGGGGANNDIKAPKVGVTLTREAARDPQAYQLAKEKASSMGMELQITD